MIIDFHSHSHASDGALSPAALLARARGAGVQQFALTDHDTVAGYRSLLASAPAPDVQLVAGVELSCAWHGACVHVVGLGLDIESPELTAGLRQLAEAREVRATIIARRLEARGMPGALAGARAVAGVSQIGRPHFAAWMVERGHVRDVNQAFDRYLGAGKTGDVNTCWPSLEAVTSWITGAGGTAVLAHPLKYRMTRMKLKRLISAFSAVGGTAMEVYSGRQTHQQTRALCELSRDFALQASVGSDFHAESEYGPELGVDTAGLPDFIDLWRPARADSAA